MTTRRHGVLFIFFSVLATWHGAAEETFELHDHGRTRQFSMALDEVSGFSGGTQRKVRRIPQRESRVQITALAAEEARRGEACDLVLYETGRRRSVSSRRILTSRISIHVAPGTDVKRLCFDAGVELLDSPVYAKGMHVVTSGHAGETLGKAAALARMRGVLDAAPLLERMHMKRFIPNDPRFGNQWHLRNTGQSRGTAGVDINVESVWDTFTGSNVLVGVVDDGLRVAHADLQANVNTVIDWDWNGNDGDPSPANSDDYHGTPCGGLVAAKGNNGTGVCGTAFDATLVGMRLIADYVSDATEAEAFSYSNSLIHIKSNSWGPFDDGVTVEGPGPLGRAALKSSAENGRGGLGTIFMWAGGNGGDVDDMANKDGYANSIYTISVTAVDNTSGWAYYAEKGSCHVVSAPSDGGTLGLTTTDWDGNYTSDFGGTSGATPIAAGTVALMLQANPGLGWRDVQEILIRTASKINSSDTGWADNGAGYHFSHKYGAGLINAAAAVMMAQAWTNLPLQQNITSADTGLAIGIPDNNTTGVTRTFDLSGDSPLRVEHVAATIDITHASRGQLDVSLTSPAGTVSRLMERHSDSGDNYSDWTFTSVHHWGEHSAGTWTVAVKDRVSGTVGSLQGVTLVVYGSQAVAPTEAPVITGSLTANGTVGEPFLYRITASNYPTAFDATPLPDGLSIQTSSGVISGVPTTAGTNAVTVSAANVVGTNTATLTLTFVPASPTPPVITSPLNAQGVADHAFAYQIEATESPTSFDASGLPPGLSIDTQSGLIDGTPTAVGTNQVVITATNGDGTGSNTLMIVVYSLQDSPVNQALDNSSLFFTGGGDAGWFLTPAITHDGVDALRSGAIGDDQETYVQTTVSGPSVLRFWWATSSEEGYDFVVLSVDGEPKRSLSGDQSWESVSLQIQSGSHVVRWTYRKDSSEIDHRDAVYLDQVAVTPGVLPSLGEALDHTAHAWVNAGDAPWSAQVSGSFDSTDAAISGWIADTEATAFQMTVDGPGQLSFYWRVSSEQDYDFLTFTMDGATKAQVSGEVDWQQQSFSVPAGTAHVLTWTYEKDDSFGEGRDLAWVDRVVYLPDGTAPGYDAWAAQVFTPTQQADDEIGGRGANPDQDRYDNLMEHALDMNALTAETNNAPVARVVGDEFVYRYRHDSGKTNLAYFLESTPGLFRQPWRSATTSVLTTQGTVELREHRHAITNRTFIRLKVTETAP